MHVYLACMSHAGIMLNKTGCKYCELVLQNCGTRQIAAEMLFVHLSAEISAHRVFRSCAEMFMQPVRYTGHVDSDKDLFFPSVMLKYNNNSLSLILAYVFHASS